MEMTVVEKQKTIQVLNPISQKGLDYLGEDYQVSEDAQGAEGILVRSYNMHQFPLPENLKAIARAGAGVNNIPIEECTSKGIPVFNTPGANANAVKELVLTTLIASSRQLFDGIEWAKTLSPNNGPIPKQVESGKKQFVGKEIRGKTLGVIGLGAIGAKVANDALELGMNVVGFDPFVSVDMAWELSRSVRRVYDIETLYQDADYITLHVPLNDKTRTMLNKDAFQFMKSDVHILNFSRGELVHNSDLKEALEMENIGKYITDFPNEDVLTMKNAIPIPHLGASSQESEENCAIMATQQLKDYIETGSVKNSVNFPDVTLSPFRHMRITAFHNNVPNMLSQLTQIVSKFGINISEMMNRNKENVAYSVIDFESSVDSSIQEQIESEMMKVNGMISVRILG
ncbi:D-3-phosphoglycerate dehydrogenase [Pelagirhabdus alkalitolerans]|uniref:D-3-phosphoglycerate dehydrogenase n=1 Tax=Pelagirhabdus alkalitolerans TaxID=1612202 RepID=A0A1G6H5V2_9BACI|nr:3-phosphoglycerate dehydrogenase family protein [Pelagirhabdus alkalitolerans]SDB89518.1 D-3-phosphoglycerate dehydrogenase [Pelagirhabdus alkalitolerans]